MRQNVGKNLPKIAISKTVMHNGLIVHGRSRWVADNMGNRNLALPLEFAKLRLSGIIRTYSAYWPAMQQYADSSPGPNVVTKAPTPLERAYPSALSLELAAAMR